jgi:hypothetical protein
VVGVNDKSLAEVALHAKDLVADGWVQGRPPIRLGEHCAGSALLMAMSSPKDENGAIPLLFEAANIPLEAPSLFHSLVNWNDAPERTKQDVLNAFDEMARLAKERGL